MSSEPHPFDHEAAIAACAAGDRRALRRLYEIEGGRMLGLALRIVRRRDIAEDVVHDAFLRIWQRASTFDAVRGSGKGWIYTIVRHRALNLVRDRAREITVDDVDGLAEMSSLDVPDPFPDVVLATEGNRLEECLGRLEPSNRASILLAYVEGCSHNEIAGRLKAPLGSVKSWIRRGLASLRECLS